MATLLGVMSYGMGVGVGSLTGQRNCGINVTPTLTHALNS